MASIFTIAGTLLILLSLAFIVLFPTFMHKLGLPEDTEKIIAILRWIVLAVIVTLFLCVIYQFAPTRKRPHIKWVLTGAIFSTVVWLLASWGFSFYVSNYGNYGEVYGSISAVVVLMLWLYITCFIILLGAEINSEIDDYVHPDSIADYKVEKKEKEKEKELKGVFIIKDGKAKFAVVETGVADQKNIEVISGVAESDSVITGPFKTLRSLKNGENIKTEKQFKPETSN